MVKKIIKYLSSLRFTILLICLLGVMFIVGLWVPQRRLLKAIYLEWQANSPTLVAVLDALGLTYVYTSPVTVTLWIFFFLNLSLVLWQRLPVIKKRIDLSDAKISDPESAGAAYPFRASYPLPAGMDGEAVMGTLRKRGYTVLGNADGFLGVKNRLSPIAFALFHVSFFLILLGGLISVYTEFIGYLDLAEGESYQGEISRFNGSPPPKLPEIGSPPSVPFTVTKIAPRVVRNTPTGISVMIEDAKGQSHEVGINTPWNVDYASFVFKHLGVAPLFVVKDASGRELDGAYVKLDVMQGRQDKFSLAGYVFHTDYYPDYEFKEGKHATRSMEFNNPTFVISVERDGKKIGDGVVGPNGAMEFAGNRLELRDAPFWVRFYVIKQRGLSIVYLGFALASIGVIWRLIFYRREILGAVRREDGAETLVVAGRSEYYKSLAEDEFNKLFNGIVGKDERRIDN